jgi:hypothetical protein
MEAEELPGHRLPHLQVTERGKNARASACLLTPAGGVVNPGPAVTVTPAAVGAASAAPGPASTAVKIATTQAFTEAPPS